MERLIMSPEPGSRQLRWVGDRIRMTLAAPVAAGWRGFLRTDLGRAERSREEVVAALGSAGTFAGSSWRDIPMHAATVDGVACWEVEVLLAEVGWFRAKAYARSPGGSQHWPEGSDVAVAVHPSWTRSANTIYCAFPRMFGATKSAETTRHPLLEDQIAVLDRHGWSAIPPSGRLRDVTAQLPHIIERLGCRIIHLLPISPTPTTFARFGRFGSPYAQLDLTAIDPALVEFDRRTTAEEQFRELADGVHLRGGRLFLDMVINHTGWGSRLMEGRPEWFRRNADGTFHSPGAWGNTWEDLVELDHHRKDLWPVLANAFLTWCRRGVDGFRCDAGYMVPAEAWRYITARVRQEFPDTVFLLEGLGGSWDATAKLLGEGGMQWAYSELFQNYGPGEIASYLDHANRQSQGLGVLVHYSETHDNDRLAKGGVAWSLMRNRLCALTSQAGAFGFTNGVEWLANEKLEVHQSRGMRWGQEPNLIGHLARMNRLIADHPCFAAGATIRRLSPPDCPLVALRRDAPDDPDQERVDRVLVLINTDLTAKHQVVLPLLEFHDLGEPSIDLLGQNAPAILYAGEDHVLVVIGPGESFCLASGEPQGLFGQAMREARARQAFAIEAVARVLPVEAVGPAPWRLLAARVDADPEDFLARLAHLDPATAAIDLLAALDAAEPDDLPRVVVIDRTDARRVTPVPPGHWILVRDANRFSARLKLPPGGSSPPLHRRSVPAGGGHVVAFPPSPLVGDSVIELDRFSEAGQREDLPLRHLPLRPIVAGVPERDSIVLLTNGRGAMTRMAADLGRITSKYDCLLGANLHPDAPTDRHVLVKRIRAWVVADGFVSALDHGCLTGLSTGNPATWTFVAGAGDGRTVQIALAVELLHGRNALSLRWSRPAGAPTWGDDLPADAAVSVTVRIDIEDRSFHSETRFTPAADEFFRRCTTAVPDGFEFQPAPDRRLMVRCTGGGAGTCFLAEAEWLTGIAHPVEAGRGMSGSGDAFSPGWFRLVLAHGTAAEIAVVADLAEPQASAQVSPSAPLPPGDEFAATLLRACEDFIVRRGDGLTVIAGYPWFLDWGRDTFIAARGLLAAGKVEEVGAMLLTFARFVDRGTLPNLLNGGQASNRDTSDAPLWYAMVAQEWAALAHVELAGHAIGEALQQIAAGYLTGTPNGIRVDPASGLVWSPSHFTWMDTNYPAATPRAGYPIEIQALWIALLRGLAARTAIAPAKAVADWAGLAALAKRSLDALFWDERHGWYLDVREGPATQAAADAVPDTRLRPNQLIAIALGVLDGKRARRAVLACRRHLVVPGGMRSLAPLPTDVPRPVRGNQGQVLNDPANPYWGRYEGDEDTRRKPAYHNGTAWGWLLPVYAEAVARAWDFRPDAVAAATAHLAGLDRLLGSGCLGHLPEILDGDAPHAQRGCDAQAWSATEALRVWLLLHGVSTED